MRPIDSEAFLNAVEDLKALYARCGMPTYAQAVGEVVKMLKLQPTLTTASISPPSEWQRTDKQRYMCYKCGSRMNYAAPFCPRCGSIMVGVVDTRKGKIDGKID